MSNDRGYRIGSWPGIGAFCVGLALIISASVLNIAHDRFSWADFDALPESLGTLYEGLGKTGVTLIMVLTGLLIIVLGLWGNATEVTSTKSSREAANANTPSAPYFCTGQGAETAPAKGRMVLETSKYVSPAAALSGIPGWSAMQRKKPSE